jgi:hypothetical protein
VVPYSGKLADQPIFTELAAGKPEDQALVEKLNARIGRATDGRRRVVVPVSSNAETARAERVAGRFNKRVIWVENLGPDGVTDPHIPGVIFLDPGSKRSLQVLAAHELTHSLERDNQAEFDKLVETVGRLVDPKEWDKFVLRLDAMHDADGIARLTEDQKVSEMVANLLSDYAYRNHEKAAGAEFSARGGEFKGYGGYLKPGAQAAARKFHPVHWATRSSLTASRPAERVRLLWRN